MQDASGFFHALMFENHGSGLKVMFYEA